MEPLPAFHGLVGQSAPMRALFDRIRRVAPYDVPVLILGETGTGKELVAGMGPKVRAIRARCGDAVGVLEGWGGEYMLELLPAGIVGVMPGLALVDVLQHVWDLGRAGRLTEAYEHFARVHPWIAYSLQSMESYNYLEKDLLIRRGLLRVSHPRHPRMELDPDTTSYARFLMDRALDAVARLGSRA
jgi:dihydrodipicolinate synthase/N-acetylneuraminate lyase